VALLYLRASAGAQSASAPSEGVPGSHRGGAHPRGRTHAFNHWTALGAKPFLFAGLVAGGPIAEHGRPIPIRGYWRDPAMPRNATTPLEGRYTGNDSWSANELDIDWQGVTSTIFTSAGAP